MAFPSRTVRLLLCALLALLFLVAAPSAWGATGAVWDPPDAPPASTYDVPRAQAAFERGKRKLDQKLWTEAADEFRDAYRLSGRATALRNLARAHREAGRLAETYETLRAALTRGTWSAREKAEIEKAMLDLDPLIGRVSITIDQPECVVTLGDRQLLPSALDGRRFDKGTYALKVVKPGFEPFEASVTIDVSRIGVLRVVMVPEIHTGRVLIRETSGRTVRVFIDGQDRGTTPWDGALAAGPHSAELRTATSTSDVVKFSVVRKQTGEPPILIATRPLFGTLKVSVTPPGASIFLDNLPTATGTLEKDLLPGKYKFLARHEGFGEHAETLDVVAGKEVVLNLSLVATKPPSAKAGRGEHFAFWVGVPFGLGDRVTLTDLTGGEATHKSGIPLGAAIGARGGYMFGWFGVEASVLASMEYNGENFRNSDNSIVGANTYVNWGVFFGPGGRVTSPGDVVRVTAGLSLGPNFRSLFLRHSYTNQNDQDFNGSYWSFAMLADIGLIVGGPPSARFKVGLSLFVDFQPTILSNIPAQTPTNTSNLGASEGVFRLTNGPMVYLGPTIGFHVGN